MRSANLFFFTQPQETFEDWNQAQQNTPFEEKEEPFFVEFQQIPINYGTITDTAYQDSLYWKEQHLYGSSRLGIAKPELEVTNYKNSNFSLLTSNFKNYELTNHLGNVLATIKDEKQQKDDNNDGIVDYYEPIVITANDYYPFGMVMPNRSFSLAGSGYRFGFNTQEKDDEVYGKGNLMTAKYWEYDTRIGRRWNVDPIVKVWESPYATNYNNPNAFYDPLGLTGEQTGRNKDGIATATAKGGTVTAKRPTKPKVESSQNSTSTETRSAYASKPLPMGLSGYFDAKPSGRYNDMRFSNEFWGSFHMEIGVTAGVGGGFKVAGKSVKAEATLGEAKLKAGGDFIGFETNILAARAFADLSSNLRAEGRFQGVNINNNFTEKGVLTLSNFGKVEGRLRLVNAELNNNISLISFDEKGNHEWGKTESKVKYDFLNQVDNGVEFSTGLKISLGVNSKKLFNSFKYF